MSDNKTSGGVGFGGLLQVAFIVLKLCKVISWSWWWVLSPTWISISIVLMMLSVVALIGLFAYYKQDYVRKKRSKVIDKMHQQIEDFRATNAPPRSKWQERLEEMQREQQKQKR